MTSGGQALAAFSRTQSRTTRRTLSAPAPGGSMTTREALSEPPPFSSTCRVALSPGTSFSSQKAGVLSPVLARSNRASRTSDMRRRPSV